VQTQPYPPFGGSSFWSDLVGLTASRLWGFSEVCIAVMCFSLVDATWVEKWATIKEVRRQVLLLEIW